MDYYQQMACECGYVVMNYSVYIHGCDMDWRCPFCNSNYKIFRKYDPDKEKQRYFIVKDVDIVEVSDNIDFYELTRYEYPELGLFGRTWDKFEDAIKITRERIAPRCFTNDKNQRVFIGFSKKVEDSLGLPFCSFESKNKSLKHLDETNIKLHKEIIKAKEELKALNKKIEEAKNMPIMKRIFNFVF